MTSKKSNRTMCVQFRTALIMNLPVARRPLTLPSPPVRERVAERRNRIARQRLGVRWVRGEGTHRFGLNASHEFESGVSPVTRQPPHSKTLRRFGRFMGSLHGWLTAHWDHERVARQGALASLPASFLAHSATRRQGCRRSRFRFMGRARVRALLKPIHSA